MSNWRGWDCWLKRRAGLTWLWLLCSAASATASLITPGAQLVSIPTTPQFFEGPTWDPRTALLYFTSLTGAGQILQFQPLGTARTWMENPQGINGMFLGHDGRLLCAQGDARRIISLRIRFDGPQDVKVLAADPAWKMPNDLCQTASGNIQ